MLRFLLGFSLVVASLGLVIVNVAILLFGEDVHFQVAFSINTLIIAPIGHQIGKWLCDGSRFSIKMRLDSGLPAHPVKDIFEIIGRISVWFGVVGFCLNLYMSDLIHVTSNAAIIVLGIFLCYVGVRRRYARANAAEHDDDDGDGDDDSEGGSDDPGPGGPEPSEKEKNVALREI